MPRYPNGQIPASELVVFNQGSTTHRLSGGRVIVENWYQGLTPGTYQKHLALVALAKKNTGRTLQLAAGFSCYRPIYGQQIARTLFGNGAATVGTSSHGGWWERRETMAMDYANWSYVYGGDRARFYADCRAVGLEPGLISRARGYPDEPWHVIDLDPWRAVTAFAGTKPFIAATEPVTPRRSSVQLKINLDGSVRFYTENGDVDVSSIRDRNLLVRHINQSFEPIKFDGNGNPVLPQFNNLELDIIAAYIRAADDGSAASLDAVRKLSAEYAVSSVSPGAIVDEIAKRLGS